MVAMRSLSLTLSSAASAKVVVPSAWAAATASTGSRRSGTGPRRRRRRWPAAARTGRRMVGGVGVRVGVASSVDVRTHAAQHVEEAGPARADVDVLDVPGRCPG